MIKNKLYDFMYQKGWDSRRTARETGVHENTIRAIYHNKNKMISYDVLEKICKTFQIGIGEFLEYVPEK